MAKSLEEIIEEYDELRKSFRKYTKDSQVKSDNLIEYQSRFTDLKAELRDHKAKVLSQWIRRDDKAATAIKFRIAVAIHEGRFKDEKGNLVYDECTINQAEKYASGSEQYKKFVDQRAFYKESYTNICDLRDDINSYIIECKDRNKNN